MENIKKNKKSIKDELQNLYNNNEKITFGKIAKNVGISVHRVKKYFKNHAIDLENFNESMIFNKKVKKENDEKFIKQQKKKMKMEPDNNHKISLGTPSNNKIKLD